VNDTITIEASVEPMYSKLFVTFLSGDSMSRGVSGDMVVTIYDKVGQL